jgi:hypothetical protein
MKKLVAYLSVAFVITSLTIPAFAQKADTNKFQDPYEVAEIENPTIQGIETTSLGTLVRYNQPLPKVNQSRSSNWTLHNLDLSGTRYADMDQINTANVKSLVPMWTAQLIVRNATTRGFQTCPVVADGIMYVTGQGGNMVEALDASPAGVFGPSESIPAWLPMQRFANSKTAAWPMAMGLSIWVRVRWCWPMMLKPDDRFRALAMRCWAIRQWPLLAQAIR